jgi:RecG-like helicase
MEDMRKILKTTSKYIAILASNGIETMQDFVNYFPRSYEDRTKVTPLSDLFFAEEEASSVITKAQIIEKTMTRR